MKELVLFSLVIYGIANIVVHSSLFTKPREFLIKINPNFLGKLVTCMMCSSTWCGFLLSFIFYYSGLTNLSPCASWGITIPWMAIFLDGCLASGTTWILHTMQEYFQYNTPTDDGE